MKNNSKNVIVTVVVVILAVVGIIWYGNRDSAAPTSGEVQDPLAEVKGGSTAVIPVSETTKVTGSLSKYQNAELGFAVEYPSSWQKGDADAGVQFIIPIDQTQVTTVNKLQADVTVTSGKCAFPPVTTVESRGTLQVGASTLNGITISNNVQGRTYYNRFYSLQKDAICYLFNFSYISLSPESKGLTGSNLTQAQNNNKALKATADTAFTAMVKTLTFVAPPAGQDETKVK